MEGVERDCGPHVLQLLTEAQRKPRETTQERPNREIVPLDMRRAYLMFSYLAPAHFALTAYYPRRCVAARFAVLAVLLGQHAVAHLLGCDAFSNRDLGKWFYSPFSTSNFRFMARRWAMSVMR